MSFGGLRYTDPIRSGCLYKVLASSAYLPCCCSTQLGWSRSSPKKQTPKTRQWNFSRLPARHLPGFIFGLWHMYRPPMVFPKCSAGFSRPNIVRPTFSLFQRQPVDCIFCEGGDSSPCLGILAISINTCV